MTDETDSKNPKASADVQQTLAELTAITQQLSPNGTIVFNVMHDSVGQRSIYRSGMRSSLIVSAGVLETLARKGHIRWMSRGVGIDTFILVSSLPQVE